MTTEEFLSERRLRAAELALEAARRRVTEADAEIVELRRQVGTLEERLLRASAQALAEPAGLRAELDAERRLRHQAEQGLWAERERARGLEEELRRRVERAASPAAERRLEEAERRVRELHSELELVRHRAAEFEQQVRLAVDAAWRWLGETAERVNAGLVELDALRELAAAQELDPEDELLRHPAWAVQIPVTSPPASSPPASASAAAPDDVIPQRFDDALDRLRAQAQADPNDSD